MTITLKNDAIRKAAVLNLNGVAIKEEQLTTSGGCNIPRAIVLAAIIYLMGVVGWYAFLSRSWLSYFQLVKGAAGGV